MAMQKVNALFIFVAALFSVSTAFNPNVVTVMKPLKRATFVTNHGPVLKMSETPEETTEAAPPAKDGTFYDDEVIFLCSKCIRTSP